MAITVRALERGFYDRPLEPGQTFAIEDESQLGTWMEPVDPEEAKRLAPKLDEMRRRKARLGPKVPAGADVPQTTAQLRDPPKPKAHKAEVPAGEPKPPKKPEGGKSGDSKGA